MKQNIVWYGCEQGSRDTGKFVLWNGVRTVDTVYGQEMGIMINNYVYLLLKKMPLYSLSKGEAIAYCGAFGLRLPLLREVWELQKVVGDINVSLEKVGMAKCKLLDTPLKDVWYQEAVDAEGEERRLITVADFGDVGNIFEMHGNTIIDNGQIYVLDEDLRHKRVELVLEYSFDNLNVFHYECDGAKKFCYYKDGKLSLGFPDGFINEELTIVGNGIYQLSGGKVYRVCHFPEIEGTAGVRDGKLHVSRETDWGAEQGRTIDYSTYCKDVRGLYVHEDSYTEEFPRRG